jgi:hypothetical protein
MGIFKQLVIQHSIISYRQVFYKKIAIKIAFCVLIPYFFFTIVQGSLIIKEILRQKNFILDEGSIKYLNGILILDLVMKLIFNSIGTVSVLPYLRLKIPKNTIINLIILSNHLNIICLLSLVISLPIWIILSAFFKPLATVILVVKLMLGFILNNYLSMVFSISFAKLRPIKIFLRILLISVLFVYLLFCNHLVLPNPRIILFELMLSCSFALLIYYAHLRLRSEIRHTLYLG